MRASVLVLTVAFLCFLPSALAGQTIQILKHDGDRLKETTTNYMYAPFLINNIFTYYSNNGDGSYNNFASNSGFEFPKGSGKTMIYEDGVVWGGFHKGGTEPKVGGSIYRHGLQAGRILTPGGLTEEEPALADDPTRAEYRIYRVRPDVTPATPFATVQAALEEESSLIRRYDSAWTPEALYEAYLEDWNQWPARSSLHPEGLAPFHDANGDGVYDPAVDTPGFQDAEQTLYYVANDCNVTLTQNFGESQPIGLEMHRVIWGYNAFDALKYTIFSRTILINKSGASIDSMFLAQWADVDVGGGGDDYMGCDTTLDLGYGYNATDSDAQYGSPVPAAGFVLLQGPRVADPGGSGSMPPGERLGYRTLDMTSFVLYGTYFYLGGDPIPGQARMLYRQLNGDSTDGRSFINPRTGEPSKFVFSGDPVLRHGWIDGTYGRQPGDRRFLLSSGPFTMANGDTQEIVTATLVAQGINNISSVSLLKHWAAVVSWTYHLITHSEPEQTRPEAFELFQNYPNPFNPSTTIRYALPQRSHIMLAVFNLLGQQVATLVNEEVEAGYHEVQFNASGLASGLYFYRLQAGDFTQVRKLCLLR